MSPTSGESAVTVVYTDGACQGNPGPGGWAWAVPGGRWRSGAERRSTNQRMEINAALDAARTLDGPLEIVSDSTYVVNCFQKDWWKKWVVNGWVSTSRQPVANRDLWEPLVDIYRSEPGRIRFRWVKGHGTDPYNDLVDRLAVAAAGSQMGGEGDAPPAVAHLGAADAPARVVRGRARAGVEPGPAGERPGLGVAREERGRSRTGGGDAGGSTGDERGRDAPLDWHADEASQAGQRASGPAMARMALARVAARTPAGGAGAQLGLLGAEPGGAEPGGADSARAEPGTTGPRSVEPGTTGPRSVEPGAVEASGVVRADGVGVVLRQGKPGDEAAVLELCVTAGVTEGRPDGLRLTELLSRQPWALLIAESGEAATGPVRVGRSGAALRGAPGAAAATGTATVLTSSGGAAPTVGAAVVVFDGWRGNVHVLAVHPAWGGKGVAALLVEEAEHRLASEGAWQVVVQLPRTRGGAAGPWAPPGYRRLEEEGYVKDLTGGPGAIGGAIGTD